MYNVPLRDVFHPESIHHSNTVILEIPSLIWGFWDRFVTVSQWCTLASVTLKFRSTKFLSLRSLGTQNIDFYLSFFEIVFFFQVSNRCLWILMDLKGGFGLLLDLLVFGNSSPVTFSILVRTFICWEIKSV